MSSCKRFPEFSVRIWPPPQTSACLSLCTSPSTCPKLSSPLTSQVKALLPASLFLFQNKNLTVTLDGLSFIPYIKLVPQLSRTSGPVHFPPCPGPHLGPGHRPPPLDVYGSSLTSLPVDIICLPPICFIFYKPRALFTTRWQSYHASIQILQWLSTPLVYRP